MSNTFGPNGFWNRFQPARLIVEIAAICEVPWRCLGFLSLAFSVVCGAQAALGDLRRNIRVPVRGAVVVNRNCARSEKFPYTSNMHSKDVAFRASSPPLYDATRLNITPSSAST